MVGWLTDDWLVIQKDYLFKMGYLLIIDYCLVLSSINIIKRFIESPRRLITL